MELMVEACRPPRGSIPNCLPDPESVIQLTLSELVNSRNCVLKICGRAVSVSPMTQLTAIDPFGMSQCCNSIARVTVSPMSNARDRSPAGGSRYLNQDKYKNLELPEQHTSETRRLPDI
jgi:hypothetical protein